MAEQRYRKSPGSVSSLRYHVDFCPERRRPVLAGEVAAALPSLPHETAADLGVTPAAAVPDHVRLVAADAPPAEAPRHVVDRLKGCLSRVLRRRFPALRSRSPSLWGRSSFIASVGRVSAAAIRRSTAGREGR
jgi:putative transposase